MIIDFIAQNDTELVFIVCAVLGGVMHYLKKFLKGETDVPITRWFGKANLTASVYTGVVFFFAIVGAIAADVINSATGFWAAMYTGFVTGFAIDSGFNSDRLPGADLIETKSKIDQLFPNKPEPQPKVPLISVAPPQPVEIVEPAPEEPEKKRLIVRLKGDQS